MEEQGQTAAPVEAAEPEPTNPTRAEAHDFITSLTKLSLSQQAGALIAFVDTHRPKTTVSAAAAILSKSDDNKGKAPEPPKEEKPKSVLERLGVVPSKN